MMVTVELHDRSENKDKQKMENMVEGEQARRPLEPNIGSTNELNEKVRLS